MKQQNSKTLYPQVMEVSETIDEQSRSTRNIVACEGLESSLNISHDPVVVIEAGRP
jgi:hypothetical protein